MRLIENGDLDWCREMISCFSHEYLDDNIMNMASFDFSLIGNDAKYGCPGRYFDADNTNIANAIYYLIWAHELPEISFNEIGIGKKYRGDTMNTFNTLFLGAAKYSEEEEYKSKVAEFKRIYTTIGNFILMPNISIMIGNSTRTINTYRGSNCWRDYFDRYLKELKYCLEKANCADASLSNLIAKNIFYFKDIDTITKYLKVNILECYFDDRQSAFISFEPYKYHWQYRNISRKIQADYIDYSLKYIDIASRIIRNRGSIMIEKICANL